jgi:hypothetical protein
LLPESKHLQRCIRSPAKEDANCSRDREEEWEHQDCFTTSPRTVDGTSFDQTLLILKGLQPFDYRQGKNGTSLAARRPLEVGTLRKARYLPQMFLGS